MCMTISKEPLGSKLKVDKNVMQQIMSFKYLELAVGNDGDVTKEVNIQTMKFARKSGFSKIGT